MRAARLLAMTLVAYLVAGLLGGPVAAAAELSLAKLGNPDPVRTAKVKKHGVSRPDEAARHPWRRDPKVAWPEVGTATVNVPAKAAATAGDLPVRVQGRAGKGHEAAGPSKVQVQVLDQKAAKTVGVKGVLVAVRSLDGAKGPVDVQVDYADFRHAYGGDWASRLTLKQLPACALSTPTKTDCRAGKRLRTDNDATDGTLSAPVALAAADETAAANSASATSAPVTVAPKSARSVSGLSASEGTVLLAATAEASGAGGDFKAGSLSPSATWSAGGSSGGFSWSYDLDAPEVPGDVQPDLSLSYSSQSVDGRTAATNNQANWIGDGWSMSPGYVERQYVSCSDDTTDSNGTDKSGDLCWKKDNAVLNLNGQSNTLIHDDRTGAWHLEDDDGTKVDKLTDTDRGNGDNNGEYWRVTTPDGTRYYFGYNRLPGWADGKTETKSTETVPVFGNQSGEPCHADAYKDSWCQQAWRWNLDYVVNPHSDAMALYWNKETNYYGRNVNPDTGASTATVYDRGSYLDHIDYGLRSDTVYGQKAAGRVDFTVSERCLSDCATFDSAHAKNWPDVPFDRYCASGTECKDRYSPTFFTRKRLTKVDTSILTGGAYKPVDSWALSQQFPATGDGSDPALWLASITRTGHTGTGDVTMPAVTFKGQQLANRVEGATTGGDPDPVPPLVRYRVYGIDTETGGTIGVTYSAPDCKAGDVPSPSSNTRRCYPVKWSPPNAPAADYEPYLDWFHSYVVTQVLEADNTGGAPVKETDYSYLDGLAWGKDEDEFTKAKNLTYGDRKGYGRVQTRTGAPAEGKQTLTESRFFRGIDGAEVKDHEGIAATDNEALAGMPREEAVFDGDGGALKSTTSYTYWRSAATATESRSGLSDRHAYATGTQSEKTRTAVGTGWRATQTDRTFDGNGQELTESDLGDTAKSGDEECTTTSYASNADKNMLDLVKETRVVAVACDKTPTLPDDLISVARHYYDSATSLDTAPTKGDVTRLDEQDDQGTGYLTTAKNTYDIHGRELTDTDAAGHTTTTAYTPATIEAPTSKTETNPLNQSTTTEYDPARGTATAEIDANGKRTDAVLDGLGRVLKVWNPGWSKTDHAGQPSTEFTYTISQSAANAVATKSLQYNGAYATTYQLYDGLLRERETQAPAIGTANRIVSETKYNTRGEAEKQYAAYYADGAPSAALTTAADNTVPSMTESLYDGRGQVTDAITRSYGDEKWRTKTAYDGDRTTVTPPKGGTATTTITDAKGRTTERLEYTDAARTASQKTTYTYGKYDEPDTVTDPAGNKWSYGFDARGQQVTADDPDKGKSTTTYDKVGNAATVTDARGTTLTTDYDDPGRKTTLRKGDTTLAKWTYDTVAKGQPTSSIRYIDGKEYTSAVTGYNAAYQPTSSTVTIPAEAGALAGTYAWSYGYNTYTGQQEWIKHPAIGNLPSERQTTVYGEGNLPQTTTAGSITLVNSTAYDVFSRPKRTEYGTLGKKVYKTETYDEVTGNETGLTTDRDLAPQRIDDIKYGFDPSGNVTSITTTSGQDAAKTTDTQCFTNDALRRLTEAWTAKTDCSTAPSDTTVGGPEPYWQSYRYDTVGNRTQLADHTTGATTTYTNPDAGSARPHAVQSATVSGGADDGRKSTFDYDAAGNTKTRTIGATTQNLTWDDEGHLASLTENGKTTSYKYDADGERLIAKDADGSQTLTLPGDNELKVTASGAKTGTRYYNHGSDTVAVRTSSGFSYLISDHQGTAMTAVAMTTLAVTRRRQLPFGAPRSEESETMPGTRGFVGGTEDPTGLIHLGAREYDPNLGRFVSVDPVLDLNDPLQMNAYVYANSRPVTASDPDGRMFYDDFTGLGFGNTTAQKHAYQKWGYRDSHGRTTKKYKRKLAYDNKRYATYRKTSYYKKTMRQAWKAAPRHKAQPGKLKRDADKARQKKESILSSIKNNIWNHLSPGGRLLAYAMMRAPGYLWDHGYVSGSACLHVCLNLGFQRGVLSFGLSGGFTFGGSRSIIPGRAGNYAGMSAGINTAVPSDQAYQLANVTVANGYRGGSAAWGKRVSGGNYYQFGWAGGRGTALQGPVLIGGTYSSDQGLNFPPYTN
ncbi:MULTISPECIES: RHS repeat domain-containing protein [unclassified Streptomyces]|uniref:RHS repeat domain-containing protein n=1 Tax=unclassified Streptomyces TaxID=2593676 RepID=UPI00278C4D06|nr:MULTISPECIES: RHS repeat-associated core domain-containing protein [unclassified Streptomyces]